VSGRLSSDDAQVGIGLSLLQDLANGMDSSDEDEAAAAQVRRRPRYSTSSVRSGIGKDLDDAVILSLGRVGHSMQDSIDGSQDGTVDGLMYGGSDDDEQGDIQPPQQQQERTTLDLGAKPSSTPSTTSPFSVSNTNLSPATSPTSGLFSGNPPHSPIFGNDVKSSIVSALCCVDGLLGGCL